MSKFEIRQDTGYGLIPKKIMRDKSLSAEAKAIYSYLASFAGNTGQAFPSTSLMSEEMNMSRNRLFKYLKELRVKKVITVKKEKGKKGQFGRNIYYLHNSVGEESPCIQNPDTDNPDTDNPDTENKDTISNSINNNSINNNNHNSDGGEFKEITNFFEQNGFGLINIYTKEDLVNLSEVYTSEWLLDAMKIAVDNNIRKLSYVRGILKKWKADGKDIDNRNVGGSIYDHYEKF